MARNGLIKNQWDGLMTVLNVSCSKKCEAHSSVGVVLEISNVYEPFDLCFSSKRKKDQTER